jgi:hypothetical protein
LEKLLLANDKEPPLSLRATLALRSAKRGDLIDAGGDVRAVYLEGRITRFAALPAAAALLLPLGQLPDSYLESDQLEQMILRFDLQPAWVHARYFTLDLAPK